MPEDRQDEPRGVQGTELAGEADAADEAGKADEADAANAAGEADAADAADEAGIEPSTEAPGRGAIGSRVVRAIFYVVWLFAAPAALAIGTVSALEPDTAALDVGAIQSFVSEQQVPATILLFTLFAMLIWRFRYVLPLALAAGVVGRTDVPAAQRSAFDDAAQLLDEAERIRHRIGGAFETAVSLEARGNLKDALTELEAAMTTARFDAARFDTAHEHAHQSVNNHLGRWRKSELREYGESIAIAVAVALVLRFFVIEAFKIPSGSMIPTLAIGDHIFVAKYAYGPLLPHTDERLYDNLPPARADVMVFKFPENKTQDFIKRVVALPGDTLEVLDGRPILDGWLVPNCYVGRYDITPGGRTHLYVEYLGERQYLTMYRDQLEFEACEHDADCNAGKACRAQLCGNVQGPYRIERGHAFVLGDNRDNSHDSRAWKGGLGAGVPFENIKGRALFVWWSWDPRAGGLAWDRLGVGVMGAPKLPSAVATSLDGELQKCLKSRPNVTVPPQR
ncbi:MAG: signal peptidase I [Myxococcales bacterium]|nr:signal peptidase I [Myxococcales bacterium]